MQNQVDIPVTQKPNLSLLTQQLEAAMPTTSTGCGYSDGSLIVHCTFNYDPVSDADAVTAAAVVAAHDPTQQSAAQQQQATIDAASAHFVSAIIPTLTTKSAYYRALTAQSADVVSGAAIVQGLNDLGVLMAGLQAWITANN